MPNVTNNSPDDMLTCRVQRCNNLGDCVIQNGLQVCKCMLGYRGDACDETVNNGLALPLTLGVLGVIVSIIVLAFVLAFVQQKRRNRVWYGLNYYLLAL